MIYTVTVNPALDYVLQLPEVKDGETNRSSDTQFLAGGKGINVSQILNQLGVDNTAWGFVGGFTGEELIRQLNVKKISSDFVRISDDTRVNVKIHAQEETEINAAGPDITDQEVAAFKSRLDELMGDQMGNVDYFLKAEASIARDVLATVQEVRDAVRENRHKSGS